MRAAAVSRLFVRRKAVIHRANDSPLLERGQTLKEVGHYLTLLAAVPESARGHTIMRIRNVSQ